ncbi:MAG: bifunctional demethylmenaquinone methyltransferase/2-methoxy-6-polyprenyl-1,4-benzoquinol methylase UbiE [Puniceicoccaceae bacterium]
MKPEGGAVNRMFAGIAGRYDRANHVLSFGVDYRWRSALVRAVEAGSPNRVLDLATGSGDVAFALEKRLGPEVMITGMDFCQPMLDEAKAKQQTKGVGKSITFVWGDAMDLALETDSEDVVTIAFGVRNFEDRQRGLREILRVLRPGGSLFVLEFSQPYRWFAPFYGFYLKHVLPRLAALVTGEKSAYDYLAGTIEAFPSRQELTAQIEEAGFVGVEAKPMTLGTVALHSGQKPGRS